MHKEKRAIFLIAIACLSWAFFAFSRFQTVDRNDWDKFFAYHEFQRKAVLEYHQIPLWNPYICGGEPWLAHPDSDFFSPLFPLFLIFGTVTGTIMIYFFQALAGVIGIYLLSRFYGVGRTLSCLNGLFFLNLFNILSYVGNFNALNLSFLPWVYLLFLRSIKKGRLAFSASVVMALLVYSGSVYTFIIASIVLAIDSAVSLLKEKSLKQFLCVTRVIIIALVLAAPKLLPMAEVLVRYRRIVTLPPWPGFFDTVHLRAGILELKHFIFSGENIYRMGDFINEHMSGYNFDAVSIILLISSYFLLWKKSAVLAAANVVFLLLALGDNSPFNLWRAFHSLFGCFKGAQKFFGGLLFSYSLTLGLSAEWLQERFLRRKELKAAFAFCALLSVCLGVFNNASRIFTGRDTINYRLKETAGDFTQGFGDEKKMFESVYNNTGVVNGYDSFGYQIRTGVMPREKEAYKGEYFLKRGNGEVKELAFSPNRLIFRANLLSEDTIVINQNYFSGWHSTQGRVVNCEGLLGVRLKKGQTTLTVYYFPATLFLGILIFVLYLFLYIRKDTRRQPVNNLSTRHL